MRILATATLAVLLAAAGPARAQVLSAGNEVWLGQVGGLNAISITQEGRDNAAGADNVWLLLGQNGVGNTLTLDQYGYANRLGTLFADEPRYARGVWQRGDRNVISIVQRNSDPAGSNILGSVQQWSRSNLSTESGAFNSLDVTQTAEGDPTGAGGHYIGRVVQRNTAEGSATPNTVSIMQRGGGVERGNVLANLRQIGSGNSFDGLQAGDLNRIGEVPPPDGSLPVGGIVQQGTQNWAALTQTGNENLIENAQQYGHANAARLRLSGDRNTVSLAYQDNESWGAAATGNRIAITIAGDDNGGTGAGWVGELIAFPSLATPGIAQAVFSQIGDDNDISLVILSGIENKYGVTQVGDGNSAHISISGDVVGADAFRNESAIFERGEVNYVSHVVTGSDNTGAVLLDGDRNRIVLTQGGWFNTSRVAITGDSNNGEASALFGVALELATSTTDVLLGPGTIIQVGTGLSDHERNEISVDITGSTNATTFYQNGNTNLLEGSITGAGNALATVQLGNRNAVVAQQAGANNSMAVLQY